MNTKPVKFLIILLIISACSAEKKIYNKARELNTIDGYEKYMAQYNNGNFYQDAVCQINLIKFNQARDSAFNRLNYSLRHSVYENGGKIRITPRNNILMGTPFSVNLENLPSNQEIIIHAYRKEYKSLLYSYACFNSTDSGKVHLNKSEPIYGTYSGVDSLGLFWSMSYVNHLMKSFKYKIDELIENTIYFYLEIDNAIIASEKLILQNKLPFIISEQTPFDTLTAMFHYPEEKTSLPVVIILNGSEGGYKNINKMAEIIASHGYAVLALAYFGMENIPKHLEKINLEYIFNAIEWVKNKPNINHEKIILTGGSRGGELALLIASLRPDIKAVIAVEPSDVLFQANPYSPVGILFSRPAWMLNGKALPFLHHTHELPTLMQFGTDARQIELMPLYDNAFKEGPKLEKAIIKVEKINGPILLIAGKDGQLWPSYHMCQRIEKRLKNYNFVHPVHALYYDEAGHYVTITPELKPTIFYKTDQVKVGGSDSGNASAQADSWIQIINFLKEYFN